MKPCYVAVIFFSIAGCTLIPTSMPPEGLNGRWRGPTVALYSSDAGTSVWQGNNTGYTLRPLVVRPDGGFDSPGRWWYVVDNQRPPGDSSAHVRFTGSVDVHTGVMFLIITDDATGGRYLRERLDADHSPIPPPPAPPPPPDVSR